MVLILQRELVRQQLLLCTYFFFVVVMMMVVVLVLALELVVLVLHLLQSLSSGCFPCLHGFPIQL